MAVQDGKEWSADAKALAACLEALLQLVRVQAGPAAPTAANDQRVQGAGTHDRPSRDIAAGGGPE